MATGQPYLAAWTAADATLRLYQMASDESAFVQVAVATLAHDLAIPDLPFIDFNLDSSRLVAYHVPDNTLATSPALDLFNLVLAKLDTKNAPQNTGTALGFFTGLDDPTHSRVIIQNKGGATVIPVTANAIGAPNTVNPGGLFVADFNDAFISEDGSNMIFTGAASGGTVILLQNLAASGPSPIPFAVQTGAFTPDLRYMMVATKDDSAVVTIPMAFDSGNGQYTPNWPEVARVTEDPAIGKPVKLVWRYDSRYLAVAFNNAGVYTTVIYQRLGDALTKKQTIANFGKTLAITKDGRFLLDAASKKAMKYDHDGLWTAANAVMANLQAGVGVAAVSKHVAQPVPDAKIYDAAVYRFASNTADLANLKISLYTGATFVPGATTLAGAVGAATEQFVSAWPQGGAALANVALAQSGSTALVNFDKLEVTVNSGGPMTFRQAIIRDVTHNAPLIFIDYGQDITIEANTTMVINSTGGPLVRFVA